MTIYILYSADYELFLGGNYCTEKEVLIDPTSELLDLFDSLHIPVTLFADVFSILRYKEKNAPGFSEMAEDQLRDAIRRGHDVQSHVHPHWNFTEIDGYDYHVNPGYFLLGNLDNDKKILYEKVRDLLETSRIYLHSLLHPVDKNYHCIAFRAGGYGLQPNPDIIIKALTDTGFLIDSSIVPGYQSASNVNRIDFSNVPATANYYLDNDLTIPSKTMQGVFEIPIASCKFDFVDNSVCQVHILVTFLQKKLFREKGSVPGRKQKGYTIQQTGSTQKNELYENVIQFFIKRFYFLDCSTSDEKMFKCTRKYLNRFDLTRQDVFFCCSMHPKIMTKDHFAALKRYHETLQNYYQPDIQAISFQQAARMLAANK